MFRRFILILDCSCSTTQQQVKDLIPLVEQIFNQVISTSPLSQCAMVIVSDQRAYFEIDFTQQLSELLSPLQQDKITPNGAFSIANALQLLNAINTKPYQTKEALLISFSAISYDSQNVFVISNELKSQKVKFSALSINSTMQVLQTLSTDLSGTYEIFPTIQLAIVNFRLFQSVTRSDIQTNNATLFNLADISQDSICGCCGHFNEFTFTCQNCSASSCKPGPCYCCGVWLGEVLSLIRVKKQEYQLALSNNGNCICGDPGEVQCQSCNVYYCVKCCQIVQQVGICCCSE
ncbi:TFIIH basal transcription factor subunit [Spironucleus salmonicida]|uniref:TFIIH basal transcription factor subunit n=1 Tax=Spironucleus salmonicida TaxID=348837 RepID=V6LSJ9_9EUKA|nr:TFIIH basal transcription factor subunit [Spironucleus salmonicida]|eukprot:EST47208.1 TFIIH basal transcription factor subunit [Spironucleus salmonicida]